MAVHIVIQKSQALEIPGSERPENFAVEGDAFSIGGRRLPESTGREISKSGSDVVDSNK